MNKFLRNILVIIFSLFLGVRGLFAQNIELNLKTAQGISYPGEWDFFPGGVELSANYRFIHQDVIYTIGMSARTIDWGNQVSVSTGISKALGQNVEIVSELQNGLALFYHKPLYTYSIGASCRYVLLKWEKIHMALSFGIRFSHCPAYRHFGSINRVLEIPLGINMFF